MNKNKILDKIKKMKAIINDRAAPEGEKEVARAAIDRILNKYPDIDYIDKKEFDAHMKKVEEAKRCGDKKKLMALSSEMIDRAGYGIYLSNNSNIQPVNSYFKNYMDKREEENIKKEA